MRISVEQESIQKTNAGTTWISGEAVGLILFDI